MPNIQLSRNLKYLRKVHNYTQDELAEFLNISRQAYSNYENSKRTPDLDTLMRFCALYSLSLDALVKTDLSAKEPLVNQEQVLENIIYYPGMDIASGNTIYLTKEETEFITKFRSLSSENRRIIDGFLNSNSEIF